MARSCGRRRKHVSDTFMVRVPGVEPLPNIRDGILVERLVKTVRYVADMRRCQYVVQRPEGARRRQRLNVEYVDGRTGDSLVLQRADQSLLFESTTGNRNCGKLAQPVLGVATEFEGPSSTVGTHEANLRRFSRAANLVSAQQDCRTENETFPAQRALL